MTALEILYNKLAEKAAEAANCSDDIAKRHTLLRRIQKITDAIVSVSEASYYQVFHGKLEQDKEKELDII